MARTAINQLQDQIEAVRREAFAAGYAAAMQSIREVTSRPAPSAQAAAAATPRRRGRRPGRRPRQAAPTAQPTRQRRARRAAAAPRATRAGGGRPQRGTNARMVEEILQAAAPRPVRPAEIRKALQDKGVAMAFTSIRHALGQLESRNSAEQIADSKTWRYRSGGSPS
ncbi:MAG TPA: hypothetical protein VEK82_07360 [Stellaceae bacterium]|nr:hypothetical protein [Stellaceae bacterium]